MLMQVTDANLMSLLSSLGFESGDPDNLNEITIDRFDHWTNSDTPAAVAMCSCNVHLGYSEKAAA
ncbi:MAG TPA: hypothetical protein VFV67_32410 [Actinophytocola sp.]|uniref:hypothetical protein n=1 Tax=Actinophytocola sp. TaxID=1872138 RepID=UPI002DBD5A69|nr:hypothetical protein [Actinophytocola sp.]HEU5475371.1 hypothetical protein [Actinophytocola sp.]